jgi:hypothetical protein
MNSVTARCSDGSPTTGPQGADATAANAWTPRAVVRGGRGVRDRKDVLALDLSE